MNRYPINPLPRLLTEASAKHFEAPKLTGANNGLMQDYSKPFGKWLASRIDAKQVVREAFWKDIQS